MREILANDLSNKRLISKIHKAYEKLRKKSN